MYLDRLEEDMLRGEMGPAVARAMELLVALGEVFEAERLVPIEGAHISGVSYKNLDEAGLEFLEDLAELGAKTRVRATLNPAGMDLDLWREMGIPHGFAERQLRVIQAFQRMGVEATCTCTPYLIGNIPRRGSQIAWAESSAVAFSNSVLGARTNRESGPSALASSITGRTPLYGYRIEENRRPGAVVEVEAELKGHLDYSALGYHIGRILGSSVPYIRGIPRADADSLKSLAAASATSGGIALFHVEGVTPEADRFGEEDLKGLERITVEDGDLEEAVSSLSRGVEDPVLCLGCPHCSLEEIWEAARLLRGRRLRGRLWIFTSRGVYREAERRGYIHTILEAGGRVFRDTCMVVAPLKEMGWREIVTDSCKAAHYASSMGLKTRLEPLKGMVEEASS
ncbi:aconitase X catalytic domain-containing protein [Candidatus Bathyarchaeota archaeon]|nr:aconitase X catalytic domain-containing protein [Candidatus Bathyarchaeota archaeon]